MILSTQKMQNFINPRIDRRNFGRTSANHRFVARYFPRSCIARLSCSVLAAFYSRISSRDQVLSTHVCATYATRGPQYRDRRCATESLLIFTRARLLVLLGDECEKRRDVSFRKSGTKRHDRTAKRLVSSFCRIQDAFPTFNGDFDTFARLSFRFDSAFTGFTPSQLDNLFIFFSFIIVPRELFLSTSKFLFSSD